MSILLDALKKSEEQRRIGQTPNIHSAAVEPPGSGGNAPRWIPVAMVAASVILMAGIGWLQLRAPEELPSAAEPHMTVQETGDAADKSPTEGRKSGAKPRRSMPVAAVPNHTRTPVETYSGNDKPAPGASPTPEPARSSTRTQVSENFRTFEAEPAENAASDQQAPATAPEPKASASRRLASKTQPEAQTAPAALEPISYWQLPQSVRDDLPELRITVLVFADKPEDRFLLVNGQRLVEKDEIPGGVVLDEIRRDGAVFQYRKYRFLVKG
ncbi:MAG: general secretion pathway protein GspB [Lysobacterales bacterium]|jgi:general secretion pathway protein B